MAANYLWARWLYVFGNTPDALWRLNNALSKSTDPAMRGRIQFGIAQLKWKLGDNAAALRSAQEALKALEPLQYSGLAALHEHVRQTVVEIEWDIAHPNPWFWQRMARGTRRGVLASMSTAW